MNYIDFLQWLDRWVETALQAEAVLQAEASLAKTPFPSPTRRRRHRRAAGWRTSAQSPSCSVRLSA
jgi:hypothetical protein